MTGLLSSLASPLAEAKISIFAISTYNTDYLLVKSDTLEQTLQILSENGHSVI
ncbi:ACT domain-containing protein [Streptomyces sp. ISL-14]|uniref:ACT domain-containing protein n=1 Tax=Bacillus sp. ISL-4 TaxID=2819125 RepID=UPI001C1C1875|nr:ACT domain-containing protein [Bacillus sp. ISL-4]MBT2670619.1 ACT domain-containing protein [Streptomyces sp. ISL-14]